MLVYYAGCCCAASCSGLICAVIVLLLLQHAEHGPPMLLFPSVPMIILVTRDVGESWFSISLHSRGCKYYCNWILQRLVIIWAKQAQKSEGKKKNTERMRGRCAQRDESSGSSRTKELVWRTNIYLKLQQPRRGGKSWRSANDEEEEEKKKKLAPNLNCEEEEKRASERASCKCAGGGKGGDLENAIAVARQSSVYIKPDLLRSRLSLLPSCLCLSRAARMDQDRSAFLVITHSQGWIDGWMNYSWWTRSTLFHWGFFIWSQRLLFTRMPILELSNYFFSYFPPKYLALIWIYILVTFHLLL
jgi:hypothetical protein